MTTINLPITPIFKSPGCWFTYTNTSPITLNTNDILQLTFTPAIKGGFLYLNNFYSIKKGIGKFLYSGFNGTYRPVAYPDHLSNPPQYVLRLWLDDTGYNSIHTFKWLGNDSLTINYISVGLVHP